jgi:rare lipoprotein A
MQSEVGSGVQPASSPLPENAAAPKPDDYEITSTFQGEISFYSEDFHGKPTASGKKFDMNAMTAAHKQLPFGTKVRVTNIDPKFKENNGKSTIIEINDRGPFVAGRVLDLSKAAGAAIGLTIKEGHILAKCEVLGKPKSAAPKPNTTAATAPATGKPSTTSTAPASTPAAGKQPITPTSTAPTTTGKPVATTPATGKPSATPSTSTTSASAAGKQSATPQAAHDLAKPSDRAGTVPANSFQDLIDRRTTLALSPREKQVTAAAMEVFASNVRDEKNPKLQFSFESDMRITSASGSIRNQMSQMASATLEAIKQGDVIVTQGGTIKQVAPGNNAASGVVLNYATGRSAFIGKPEITKRTGLQLKSGYGQFSVTGYDINNKRPVGATIVTPLEPGPHPTGNITVPDWGTVKLSDPLYPGCLYTWADVSRNGTRVPTKAVMQGAIKLAQAIHPYHAKYSGGKKWKINSWYRPPSVNAGTKGAAKNSRHLIGDAIDFSFPGCFGAFWKDISVNWVGGYCIYSSWIHLDTRGHRQTWSGG